MICSLFEWIRISSSKWAIWQVFQRQGDHVIQCKPSRVATKIKSTGTCRRTAQGNIIEVFSTFKAWSDCISHRIMKHVLHHWKKLCRTAIELNPQPRAKIQAMHREHHHQEHHPSILWSTKHPIAIWDNFRRLWKSKSNILLIFKSKCTLSKKWYVSYPSDNSCLFIYWHSGRMKEKTSSYKFKSWNNCWKRNDKLTSTIVAV